MAEKTVKLISGNGAEVGSVRFSAKQNLPQAVIFGVNERQRVFVRDGGENYHEVSFVWVTENKTY